MQNILLNKTWKCHELVFATEIMFANEVFLSWGESWVLE